MSRPIKLAAALVLAALLAGACAAIPTSGSVERVSDDVGLGESSVRYSPAGPTDGATKEQVLRGFLDAMLAYPVSSRVAAQFLTKEAAKSWRPGEATTVYSSATPVGDGRTDAIELQVEAYLDEQGRLSAGTGTERLAIDFRREGRQWRIATAPIGVLVSVNWFEDYVRPFELYFLDDSGSHVVPVPIHEVVGDQLATSLITSLAIGPTGVEPPGLTTSVPESADIRASVPIVGQTAEVEFETRVGDLSAREQRRLSAQIAWTLRQVPTVSSIQITGAGTVVAPTGDAVQDALGWASFGPDKSRPGVVAIAADKAHEVNRDSAKVMLGTWGKSVQGALMVAAGQEKVVGVWRDFARITETKKSTVTVRGFAFGRPVIDIDGGVWLVDQTRGRARVRFSQGEAVRLLPGLDLPALTSFAISPDGARYAVTVGGSIYVGQVQRRDRQAVALTKPRRLPSKPNASEVVWVSGVRLAYLDRATPSVQSVRIDGTGEIGSWPGGGQLLPKVNPVSLFATPAADAEVYLLDDAGDLWVLDRTRWVRAPIEDVTGIG